jgi:hypothetical protein
VNVLRIAPARKTGHHVEFSKEAAHDLIGVLFCREVFQLADDAGEGVFDRRNRTVGIVFALLFKATLMFHELFSIKIGKSPRRLRLRHVTGEFSVRRSRAFFQPKSVGDFARASGSNQAADASNNHSTGQQSHAHQRREKYDRCRADSAL